MLPVVKPTLEDLHKITEIMSFWVEEDEVEKYIERIKNEIEGKTEFNIHFWVVKDNDEVVGVTGLCDPLPNILKFAKTKYPGELKILYLDPNSRGKGIGRKLLVFIENEARKQGYKEILIRSAKRFRDTAYGFYERMGYSKVGMITSESNSEQMQVFEKKL